MRGCSGPGCNPALAEHGSEGRERRVHVMLRLRKAECEQGLRVLGRCLGRGARQPDGFGAAAGRHEREHQTARSLAVVRTRRKSDAPGLDGRIERTDTLECLGQAVWMSASRGAMPEACHRSASAPSASPRACRSRAGGMLSRARVRALRSAAGRVPPPRQSQGPYAPSNGIVRHVRREGAAAGQTGHASASQPRERSTPIRQGIATSCLGQSRPAFTGCRPGVPAGRPRRGPLVDARHAGDEARVAANRIEARIDTCVSQP